MGFFTRQREGRGFIPIQIEDYVRLHAKSNPGVERSDLVARLKGALAAFRSGERCRCGEPIWVIGSAEVGHACFTCITGEAVASGDYELVEACEKAGDEETGD